jgi:hypothetical protein
MIADVDYLYVKKFNSVFLVFVLCSDDMIADVDNLYVKKFISVFLRPQLQSLGKSLGTLMFFYFIPKKNVVVKSKPYYNIFKKLS